MYILSFTALGDQLEIIGCRNPLQFIKDELEHISNFQVENKQFAGSITDDDQEILDSIEKQLESDDFDQFIEFLDKTQYIELGTHRPSSNFEFELGLTENGYIHMYVFCQISDDCTTDVYQSRLINSEEI